MVSKSKVYITQFNHESRHLHPKDKANFLSHLLFCWQIPLLVKNWRNQIKDDEYMVPTKDQESKMLGDKIEKIWNKERSLQKKPSLTRAIFKTFGKEIILSGLIFFPFDMMSTKLLVKLVVRQFSETKAFMINDYFRKIPATEKLELYEPNLKQVFVSGNCHTTTLDKKKSGSYGKLLNYFTQSETHVTKQEAYFYGFIIILSTLLRALSFQFFIVETFSTGMKVRISCSSLIYRKLLSLRKDTIQRATLGRIINLLSNDVDKFDRAFNYLHTIWLGILKVIIASYLLYIWFGYEGLTGAGILVLFLFLQIYFFKVIASVRMKVALKTDQRIRIMNDIIFGIRAVKMYTWESSFAKLIKIVRKSELNYIARSNFIQNTNFTLVSYMHKLPVYVFVLMIILSGSSLSPHQVFMSINIYDILRQTLQYSTAGICQLSEIKTSVLRIQDFLLLNANEEIEGTIRFQNERNNLQGYRILLKDVSAKWDLSLTNEALNNVNLELRDGETVAIIGAAGGGKSTLLQVILKELSIISGSLYTKGSISYASQEPWIFPATVRQNIIFCEEPDEAKYLRVIKVCALEHDMSLFSYGDDTLVGERGVMLSGGQKARINLARAIYRNADIYLLDDPLSAVDKTVASHIFTKCFLEYLKEKSVVLVTHQLQFLRNIDRIYILETGKVTSYGRYNELELVMGKTVQKYEKKQTENDKYNKLEISNKQSEIKEDSGNANINRYKIYLTSGHLMLCFLQILLLLFNQIFINGSDVFLSFWVNLRQHTNNLDSTSAIFFTDLNCLYIYTTIVFLMILSFHLNTWTFVDFCKRASNKLHDSLLQKILKGSMNFFDYHSSGRILNRFSRDMGLIDELIPRSLYYLIKHCFAVSGICIVVVALNYWIIIPTILLNVLFYLYMLAFNSALNHLKRISATRKSPIFTHVSGTVQGLTTIKALKAEEKSLSKFDDYQNCFNSVEYIQKALYFGYAYWIDFTCCWYTAVIIFYQIIVVKDALVGNVGLSITQSLLLIGCAQYALKMYGELDSQMTSVERVVEYADLVPEEDKGTFLPPKVWPDQGIIRMDSVSMQYSMDKAFVLKRINLFITSGEKVGIIGRTGSGKSSLISTLFRLYDFEGKIIVDNVDIKSVPLKILRSRISIIPQDPVFFLGTLRKNLDPFDEFDDQQLWSCLEDVNLKQLVASLPSGLESLILEGGANFSIGQRQMMCLVRAILKNSKIIVLDEATANVDLETDSFIQNTIRRRFKNSTVLTIAHRLDSIMDSDKIVVMDAGVVVEFGTIDDLLQNPNGYFYKSVNNT